MSDIKSEAAVITVPPARFVLMHSQHKFYLTSVEMLVPPQEKEKPLAQSVQQQPSAKESMVVVGGNRNANNMTEGPNGRPWSYKLLDCGGHTGLCECGHMGVWSTSLRKTNTQTRRRSGCILLSMLCVRFD